MHLGIARTGIGDMSAHDEYLPLTMIETQLSRSDEFRRNAAACEQLAEHAIDALAKQTFRKLVAQWRRLAELAERPKKGGGDWGHERSGSLIGRWRRADFI